MLADSETVTTKSEGKEPNRFVIIVPNDLDESSRPYNAGKRGSEHGRGGRNGRCGRNDKRGGYGGKDRSRGRERRSGSGFTEEKRKAPSGFGTYLGNSLKDKK